MRDIIPQFYKNLYIGDSNINGKGLFAGEQINAGDKILSFGGVLAFVQDRNSGMYLNSTFSCLTEDIMICEGKNGEKDYSDYINHSCDPNAGMLDAITIVAIRDIERGQEILCDYSFWEADSSWILKYSCNCGSKHCRGRITGQDWKRITRLSQKFQYYAPFIQRRIIALEENSNNE